MSPSDTWRTTGSAGASGSEPSPRLRVRGQRRSGGGGSTLNRIRFVRRVGLLMTLAMVVGLIPLAAGEAHADTTGTPPNVVDYNRVPADYQEAVLAFEGQAAREVLANHSLPESDFNAVRGWAR